MFESFNMQNMSITCSAAAALYSYGRTTGLLIDSGESMTSAINVIDGKADLNTYFKMSIGGRALDEYCCKLLN